MTQKGKKNPNWRGGRTITSHGYVLIRVGKEHHLADVRGYAYEHRIIAEQKLDRRLRIGELIHHINNDRTDNRPENLKIVGNNAEHLVYHRKYFGRRFPGEKNPVLECRCGCGMTFFKFDMTRRPRQYISGHNPHPAPAQQEIIRALERGAMHRKQLAGICGKSINNISVALAVLKKKKLIHQISRGVWGLIKEK